MMLKTFFIGWDVGGWNCDRNSKSRDAIVILDQDRQIVGQPWRGNLRESINLAATSEEWVSKLFELCWQSGLIEAARCIIAIDTPLGFSKAFVRLVRDRECAGEIGASHDNPYLFRETERYLLRHGMRPLSPVKDMIGSQATKGMHVLSRFAPRIERCGVWTDGRDFQAIEAYPSACKNSKLMAKLRKLYPPLGHEDKEDALICALMAYMFGQMSESLEHPSGNVPDEEGWIWVPRDVFREGVL